MSFGIFKIIIIILEIPKFSFRGQIPVHVFQHITGEYAESPLNANGLAGKL